MKAQIEKNMLISLTREKKEKFKVFETRNEMRKLNKNRFRILKHLKNKNYLANTTKMVGYYWIFETKTINTYIDT